MALKMARRCYPPSKPIGTKGPTGGTFVGLSSPSRPSGRHPMRRGRPADGRLQEVVAVREQRQFEARGCADLVENAREMVLHRLFGDFQLPRDFLVGSAGGDRDDDLALA